MKLYRYKGKELVIYRNKSTSSCAVWRGDDPSRVAYFGGPAFELPGYSDLPNTMFWCGTLQEACEEILSPADSGDWYDRLPDAPDA